MFFSTSSKDIYGHQYHACRETCKKRTRFLDIVCLQISLEEELLAWPQWISLHKYDANKGTYSWETDKFIHSCKWGHLWSFSI